MEEESWLICLQGDIHLREKLISYALIHYDSTTTIAIIDNRYYNGSKCQIRRKHNNVRNYISKGVVRVDRECTDENLAYPLIKGLAREKVHNTSSKICIMPKIC